MPLPISVDWNLASQQADAAGSMAQAGYTGATQGLELGQKQAALSALRGVNLQDPSSVQNALTGLVKVGAADQAQSVLALQKQSMLAAQYARGAQAGGPNPSSLAYGGAVPALPPASAPAPATTDPNAATPADPSGPVSVTPSPAQQLMLRARLAVSQLQQLPQDQRPAAWAQMEPQFTAAGVPKAAMDADVGDLSDGKLQQAGAKYDAHLDQHPNFGGSPVPGQPLPANAPADHDWTQVALSPDYMRNAAIEKAYLGIDSGPTIETARALSMPAVQQQAESAYAPAREGAIESARKGVDLAYMTPEGLTRASLAPPMTGMVPTATDANGRPTAWGWPSGALKGIEGQSLATTLGSQAGETAYAGAKAGAVAKAQAPYTFQTVPVGGRPTMMTTQKAAGLLGANAPGVGEGLTPGAAAGQEGDARNAMDFVSKLPQTNLALNQAEANGQKIVGLAHAVTTGKYTPQLTDLARTLPLSHGINQYATNSSLLAQDLSASFKDMLGGMNMPRLSTEAHAIVGAMAKNSSPQDQITLTGAGLQAMASYSRRMNNFISSYVQAHPDAPSLTAAQNAWVNGPGRSSILAEPAYRGLTLSDGSPAVHIDPKSGQGVFLPSSAARFAFRAQ